MQVHIVISGLVQNIGFRYFVKSEAKKQEITGWVKNREDNSVEALFQGDEAAIQKLIDLCWVGPFGAQVKDVSTISDNSSTIFPDFKTLS